MKAIIWVLLFSVYLSGCKNAYEEGFIDQPNEKKPILINGYLDVTIENWVTMDSAFAFFNQQAFPIESVKNYSFKIDLAKYSNFEIESLLWSMEYIWNVGYSDAFYNNPFYLDTIPEIIEKDSIQVSFNSMPNYRQFDWLNVMKDYSLKEIERFDHMYRIVVEEGKEEEWKEKLIREKYVEEVFYVYDEYTYY